MCILGLEFSDMNVLDDVSTLLYKQSVHAAFSRLECLCPPAVRQPRERRDGAKNKVTRAGP